MAEAITESSNDNLISFEDVPISALRQNTRQILSRNLTAIKILRSENDHYRDWRGIYHLSELDNCYWDFLKSKSEPFIELIDIWSKEKLCKANFAKLQMIFGLIDRWDVFDDTKALLEEDAKIYQKCKAEYSETIVKLETEENNLTIDDVLNSCLQHYDAFILYADEDFKFAKTIIDFAESKNLKVCVRDRDLLAGISFEHDAIRRLLTDRCNRLVVILSKSFIQSPADKFITKVAQRIGMQQGNRKIVPIIIEEHFVVPQLFEVYHPLSYTRSMKFGSFWKKLERSLIVDNNISNSASNEAVTSTNNATLAPTLTPTNTIESTTSQLERAQSTNNVNLMEQIPSGSKSSGAIKKSSLHKFFRKKKKESNSTSDVETSDNIKNEQKKSKKKPKKEKV